MNKRMNRGGAAGAAIFGMAFAAGLTLAKTAHAQPPHTGQPPAMTGPAERAGRPDPPERHEAPSLDAKDSFGMTPLQWAVTNGLQDEVATLLAAGADPNSQDDLGATALHRAASEGRIDMVQMLLAAKARTDIKDEDGMTPIQWAAMGGYEDVVKLLAAVPRHHH